MLWADRSHTQELQVQLSPSPSAVILLMPLLFVLMTQTPTGSSVNVSGWDSRQMPWLFLRQATGSIDTAVIPVRSCRCSVLGLAEEGGRLLKQCRMRHRWKKGHVTSDEYVMTMSPKSSL